MSLRTITSAADLMHTASDQTISLPPRLNPAFALVLRNPQFESMGQVRAVAARIAWGIETWAEFSAAVTTRNLTKG